MTSDSEMRRLAEAATGGPWTVYRTRGGTYVTRPDLLGVAREWSLVWQDADAEFIAAAREKIPELLDRVAAAEARRDLSIQSEAVMDVEHTEMGYLLTAAEAEVERLRSELVGERISEADALVAARAEVERLQGLANDYWDQYRRAVDKRLELEAENDRLRVMWDKSGKNELLAEVERLTEERDALGTAAFAAYRATGADPDTARTWEQFFRPITAPSWVEVVEHEVSLLREEAEQAGDDYEMAKAENAALRATVERVRRIADDLDAGTEYIEVSDAASSIRAALDEGGDDA